jgi:hypothetical protein
MSEPSGLSPEAGLEKYFPRPNLKPAENTFSKLVDCQNELKLLLNGIAPDESNIADTQTHIVPKPDIFSDITPDFVMMLRRAHVDQEIGEAFIVNCISKYAIGEEIVLANENYALPMDRSLLVPRSHFFRSIDVYLPILRRRFLRKTANFIDQGAIDDIEAAWLFKSITKAAILHQV